MTIHILSPGTLASVQDLGRPEWRASGVPLGGAADTLSHRLANFLVGNDAQAATLEIAGGNFRAAVTAGGWLAVGGAGGRFFVDKKEVGNGRLVCAPKGAEVNIRANEAGNYAYLATPGGWDVPEVLDSRSTCLSASFGGFEGRGLRKGDVLKAVYSSDDLKLPDELDSGKIGVSKWFLNPPNGGDSAAIRVLPGPEIQCWDAKEQEQFFDTPFIISAQRDRMGLRLETNPTFGKSGTMLSTTVAPGAVQVPPDGQPIVLLADAQTTGGYPRIAQVVAVDIPRLAQMPIGKTVRFQQVDLDEAEQLFFEQENLLQKIQLALRFVDRCSLTVVRP